MANFFAIKNIKDNNDFWSNVDGWVDTPTFDLFTLHERDTLNLPIDGEWVTISINDDENVAADTYFDIADMMNTPNGGSVFEHVEEMRHLLSLARLELNNTELGNKIEQCLYGVPCN